MKNDPPVNDLSDIGPNRYPHIKITKEEFPRALATRLIEVDGDDYYGAFLPKTAARILIDFLNRAFRLRSCDIPIDGTFPVPCTQYFRRRCVAPCVAEICAPDAYMKLVSLARKFLANDRDGFIAQAESLIEQAAALENFETAARIRDVAIAVDRFWSDPRKNVWLEDAVDTFDVDESDDEITIHLVTHRRRKVLGRKIFVSSLKRFSNADAALSSLLDSFYVCHLPREIRVPIRLSRRAELETSLSHRFGRQVKISVSDPARKGVNAFRGLNLSRAEQLLDKAKPTATPKSISAELKAQLALDFLPKRIDAFDVAHISRTAFAAARSVWEDGRFLSAEYNFIISERRSELEVLAEAVEKSVAKDERSKRLILLDGGTAQLNMVTGVLNGRPHPHIVAAVKPKGNHSSVAAFLTEAGGRFAFDINSAAHAMLQLLRDEAHDLANRAHRDYREMLPFYEAQGFDRPLVVPLRFHAVNGGADDLIPINAR